MRYAHSAVLVTGLSLALSAALSGGCGAGMMPEPTPGPQGLPGFDGPAGADGQLRIYGNGSAGDVTVAASADLFTLVTNGNTQFRNLTINAGMTLTVPSGAVIRCSETFVNNGLLKVALGEFGEGFTGGPGDPGQGVAHQPAGQGVIGTDQFIRGGGRGGIGLSADESRFVLTADPRGGGAGFATGGAGGRGGGRVIVLARTSIQNGGEINADGGATNFAGSGGGAGGVIVLASPGFISTAGVLSARGSAAGGAGSNVGAGGGGGGGGGACGGNGGTGGSVTNAPFNDLNPGQPGTTGHSLQTIADPTAFF